MPCIRWGLTRHPWDEVARRAGVPLVRLELVCSDLAEHRARVEDRHDQDAACPDWAAVQGRNYEPWAGARRIDTAGLAPTAVAMAVMSAIVEAT